MVHFAATSVHCPHIVRSARWSCVGLAMVHTGHGLCWPSWGGRHHIHGPVILATLNHRTMVHVRHIHFAVIHTRSEEHTSELQSLMRISYAVFCLKKKNIQTQKSSTLLHKN